MVFEMASSQPLYVRAVSKYVQRCLQKSVLKGKVPKGIDIKVAVTKEGTKEGTCEGHDEEKVAGVEVGGGVYGMGDKLCTSNVGDAAVEDSAEACVVPVSGAASEERSIAPTAAPVATPTSTSIHTSALALTAPSLSLSLSAVETSVPSCISISPSISASMSRSLSDNDHDNGQAVGDRDLLILQSSQGSAQDQPLRERELLEDFDVAYREHRDISGVPLMCAGRAGPVYCSSDFVTASVEMNRSLFNGQLAGEEKRRVLFGSDQIVP